MGSACSDESGPPAGSTAKRILDAVHLKEISLVPEPSNDRSRILALKSAVTEVKTIREFEDFLRDVGGYSAAQAKLIASSGFKSIDATRDAGDGQLEASVESLIGTLSGKKVS